jgi:hypothetical protein
MSSPDANDDQGGMTAERARRLAAALIAAADELEVLGL